MRYLSLVLVILSLNAFSREDCAERAAKLARAQLEKIDYDTRKNHGIHNDGKRWNPPTNCTEIMASKKMIPLSKRKSAGVNRERFMDNDCHVYEWDYQHGRFEKYKVSKSGLEHVGEMSPVMGVDYPDKKDTKRNYTDMDSGYNMKLSDLCKEHKKNLLTKRFIEKNRGGVNCI